MVVFPSIFYRQMPVLTDTEPKHTDQKFKLIFR